MLEKSHSIISSKEALNVYLIKIGILPKSPNMHRTINLGFFHRYSRTIVVALGVFSLSALLVRKVASSFDGCAADYQFTSKPQNLAPWPE